MPLVGAHFGKFRIIRFVQSHLQFLGPLLQGYSGTRRSSSTFYIELFSGADRASVRMPLRALGTVSCVAMSHGA